MDEPNYDRLGFLLLAECNNAISLIQSSDEFKDIYAFCIDLDPDNGGFRISWNTESAFNTTADLYKNKYNHTHESLYQFFWGTKYNSGDFTFHLDNFQDSDVVLSELDALFLAHSELCFQLCEADALLDGHEQISLINEKLIDQAIWVINQIDFKGLDCTSDFIAFVTLHDADDNTLLSLLKRTVSSSTVDNLPARIE
jgi:Domain of unknown function (DUF4303)